MTLPTAPIHRRAAVALMFQTAVAGTVAAELTAAPESSPVTLPDGAAAVFPVRSEWEPDPIFLQLGPQAFQRVSVLSAAAFDALPPDRRPGNAARIGETVVTLGTAPRWEVASVCSGPQPTPTSCSWDGTEIRRTWKADGVRFCRRCAVCSARPSLDCEPGEVVCSVCPDGPTYRRLLQVERELDLEFDAALDRMTPSERLEFEDGRPTTGVLDRLDAADAALYALAACYSESPSDPPAVL